MSTRKKPSKASIDSKLPRYMEMTPEQYHADFSAIGRSGLWTFHERRKQYLAEYVEHNAPAKNVTRVMDIGSLAHVGLLEPKKFPAQYAVFPESVLDGRGGETTNASKAFRETNEAKGLIVLKRKDFEAVEAMVSSVKSKLGDWGWLDVPAKKEQAIYWTHEKTGLKCKTLIDWLIESKATTFILDVKTTGDASPSAFKYRVEDGGLWLQDAHYSEGAGLVTQKPVEFYFIVVETKFPHACSIQALEDETRQSAVEFRDGLMADLSQCLKTGNWDESWEHDITKIKVRPSCFAAA